MKQPTEDEESMSSSSAETIAAGQSLIAEHPEDTEDAYPAPDPSTGWPSGTHGADANPTA
jgi:hypothetical protein